jgi:hypothetical protein
MLGRVFCAGCGSKLDLSNIGGDEIDEMGKESRLLSYWPLAVLGLVVLIIIMGGLAFWPPAGKIGDQKGRSSDASIVKSQVSLISRMGKGRQMKVSFTDKQLNKYLSTYIARKLGTDSLSVDIEGDEIEVRLAVQFGPYGPESYRKKINLVLDVSYTAKGDKLIASGGSIGHLPMPGPLAKLPNMMLKSSAKKLSELKSMKYLKEISIEDGRISLRAAK